MANFTPYSYVPINQALKGLGLRMPQFTPEQLEQSRKEAWLRHTSGAVEPVAYADIVPSMVKDVTGSDELALVSSFFSPSSFVKRAPKALGLTTWHGSPHKIGPEGFKDSAIGTGEGAQAYGHGHYLGGVRATGETYRTDRSYVGRTMAGKPDNTEWDATRIAQEAADIYGVDAVKHLEKVVKQQSGLKHPKQAAETQKVLDAISLIQSGKISPTGYLYKTDIPDEAVARFLDWDKPLSEQGSILGLIAKEEGMPYPYSANKAMYGSRTGQDFYHALSEKLGGNDAASRVLDSYGVQGIRYLDGGSRSAGQGSSNFAVFDPKMIRILERNDVPTGQQPWKPGEWANRKK